MGPIRSPSPTCVFEELGVTFNHSGSSLDVPYKCILSHLSDLKYAGRKMSDLEKEVKEQE
jgi:hypothetical protein